MEDTPAKPRRNTYQVRKRRQRYKKDQERVVTVRTLVEELSDELASKREVSALRYIYKSPAI